MIVTTVDAPAALLTILIIGLWLAACWMLCRDDDRMDDDT